MTSFSSSLSSCLCQPSGWRICIFPILENWPMYPIPEKRRLMSEHFKSQGRSHLFIWTKKITYGVLISTTFIVYRNTLHACNVILKCHCNIVMPWRGTWRALCPWPVLSLADWLVLGLSWMCRGRRGCQTGQRQNSLECTGEEKRCPTHGSGTVWNTLERRGCHTGLRWN